MPLALLVHAIRTVGVPLQWQAGRLLAVQQSQGARHEKGCHKCIQDRGAGRGTKWLRFIIQYPASLPATATPKPIPPSHPPDAPSLSTSSQSPPRLAPIPSPRSCLAEPAGVGGRGACLLEDMAASPRHGNLGRCDEGRGGLLARRAGCCFRGIPAAVWGGRGGLQTCVVCWWRF